MLEKQDLQAIKELIDTSVNSAITASEERTQAKLDAMEARLQAKIDDVDQRLQGKIDDVDQRLQGKIDDVDQRLQGKIDDVDQRLQGKIDDVDNHWRAYAESYIVPNFKLLAEGHQTLLDTLAPKSRVDNLEDDVVFLKSIVKTLMQEVSDLKKAQ